MRRGNFRGNSRSVTNTGQMRPSMILLAIVLAFMAGYSVWSSIRPFTGY